MNTNMYWILALALVLGFAIRFVIVYMKAKQKTIETETQQAIWKHAPELISEAEEAYASVEKAGQQKMQMCIDALLPMIPDAVAGLFTGDIIRSIVQTVFNSMKEFADFAVDKAAEQAASKKEEPKPKQPKEKDRTNR